METWFTKWNCSWAGVFKTMVYTVLCLVLLGSCTISSPKYATYDDVMKLYVGMSLSALQDTLGLEPNYIKKADLQDGITIYDYKYRLKELKRFPLFMKKNTGFEADGEYVDLLVTVDSQNTVLKIETCTTCTQKEQKTTIVDFNSIIRGITTMVTVTLPAVLVFLSNA
ncbi:hypothetical protein GC194_15510 [bacterium]|nr:hypothetical protein [bacterium]